MWWVVGFGWQAMRGIRWGIRWGIQPHNFVIKDGEQIKVEYIKLEYFKTWDIFASADNFKWLTSQATIQLKRIEVTGFVFVKSEINIWKE